MPVWSRSVSYSMQPRCWLRCELHVQTCRRLMQAYSSLKKAEHAMKSIRYDGTAVSVVNPSLYAKRFIEFMRQQVFCGGSAGEDGTASR